MAGAPIRVGILVIPVCFSCCTPGLGVDGHAHLRPGAPEVLYPVVPKGEHTWISPFSLSLAHLCNGTIHISDVARDLAL